MTPPLQPPSSPRPSKGTRAVRAVFVVFWCLMVSASLLFKASARFTGWPDENRCTLEENRYLAECPRFRVFHIRDALVARLEAMAKGEHATPALQAAATDYLAADRTTPATLAPLLAELQKAAASGTPDASLLLSRKKYLAKTPFWNLRGWRFGGFVRQNGAENRIPAARWGAALDDWYNDHFAWRACLITFYRWLHLSVLHSPLQSQFVPGRGDWVFRRSGSWAEMEDYLGVFELTPDEIARWLEFFEGRVQWAEAHGAHYLEVITPVKAQIHPERMLPIYAAHHRPGVGSQIRAALSNSPVRSNVVFVGEAIADITRRNQTDYFYATDHHVNGYGCYVIYREMMRAAEQWFGPMDFPPYYDVPPDDVREGRARGCFRSGDPGYERLSVRMPGAVEVRSPFFGIYGTGGPRSARFVCLEFPDATGTNRLAIAHDSFLRFPLRSWYRPEEEPVRFPVSSSFCRALSLMHTRYSTLRLDCLVSTERPNLIVEQFPEIKLTQDIDGYDEVMHNAALYGRGRPVDSAGLADLPSNATFSARAVLHDVTDATGEWHDMRNTKTPPLVFVDLLDAHGNVLTNSCVFPGPIRAAFFPPLPVPTPDALPLRITLRDGTASSTNLSLSAH